MTLDDEKAKALEMLLREHLESDVIAGLASRLGMSMEDSMDCYYRSRLAASINCGENGVQYLSPGYLVDDLLINEPELFANHATLQGDE